MMYLVFFLLLVKFFLIEKEGDKWQVVIGIFFVFIMLMVMCVGLGIVFYLFFFVVFGIIVLVCFVMFYVCMFGGEGEVCIFIGVKNCCLFFVWLMGFVLFVVIFLFVFFLWFCNLYIMGGGFGLFDLCYVIGFSDEVNFDVIGSICMSDLVVLCVQFEGGCQFVGFLWFKVIVYDCYEDKCWLCVLCCSWECCDLMQGVF